MNKKKFVVLALLMIAVIVLSSCMLVACNNDTDDDNNSSSSTIKETEGLLIKNGDFKVIDTASTTYPRSITSWTGAKMYSSGDYKSDVTAGAISLDKALYDANKSKWNDDNDELYNKLIAGGRYDEDDVKNALMVYMPVEGKDKDDKTINGPTAYGYTSTSFTLDKGSYYKLSVNVLTYKIDGKNEDARGARIYVSSNTYAEFDGIDTNGTWKTYEIYIESSPTSSTSLSVMLGLGKCTASSEAGLTTGYAVFDNLSLVKIEDADADAKSVYFEAEEKELNKVDNITTTTLKVPNGRFDFGTTTLSSSGTPNSWSLMAGNSSSDDPAPTAPRHNGIVDLEQLVKDINDNNLKSYSPLYKTKGGADAQLADYRPAEVDLVNIKDSIFSENTSAYTIGSNAFLLSQHLMTAQGIKSSRTITIEKNKTYALSVDLYTYGIHGEGVTLKLTGSDGKDIVIKGISGKKSTDYLIGNRSITVDDTTGYVKEDIEGATNSGWTTYTFYITGNQFRNYSYNMEIWLGTGGTNDNTSAKYHSYTSNTDNAVIYNANGTFSNGWVFVDNLRLIDNVTISENDFIVKADESNTLDCEKVGQKTGIIVDLTSENMFEHVFDNTTSASSMPSVVASTVSGVPTGWTSNYDTTKTSNPIITNLITDGLVSLVNEEAYLASGGIGTYPDLPYEIDNKLAYMINASADSYYEIETAPITIKANNYYRMSMWVKTQDIKSTSGAYVYVLQKNGEGEDDTTLATFSKVNTADYDEYQNDWCELTVVICGSNKEDTTISFKFTLGTGTRWTSSTLASGSMFIANINGGNISHSTYSGTATGTYVKAVDLSSSSSYAFKNGGFDSYDVDDENLDENKSLADQTVAATPSDWTISDNKLNANTDDSNLVAGVIKFNTTDNLNFTASAQANSAFKNTIDFDGFYPTIAPGATIEQLNSLPGSKGHVLAIGNNSANSTGYAVGFASSSVTLSANTYYRLSFYARTYGSTKATAYLSGESSLTTGVSSFSIESTDSMGWTKYTFYIEVGQTSVSTKLNLWLGENVDYIEISDAEYEAVKDNTEYAGMEEKDVKKALKEKKAVSTGNVFFDNIYYTSIDEADYNKAVEGTEAHKLSFLTDSFDALSSTVDSRGSLSTPNGWTGTVGTSQSSSNTKSGVVYADHNYYEVETIGEGENAVEYARILGKEYKLADMTYSDKEVDEYIELHPEFADKKDEAIAEIQKAKLEELQKANWIPTSVLKAHSGNQMLVINNTEKSAYTYTSSSVTLKENSYYQVSVFVKTYGIGGADNDDTIGANIELYLGSANETDNPFAFKAINCGEYTEYKFFVKTQEDDVTSVTVKLSLGTYVSEEVDGEKVVTGLTSGYAMFDDVTITKIDETEFDNATESDLVLKRTVSTETKGEGDEDDDDTNNETPDSTFNTEALWWMIPTIVLGLLIIIVVVVFVVRKVRKPIAKKKEKKVATPQETPSLDAKRDKYDDNKE